MEFAQKTLKTFLGLVTVLGSLVLLHSLGTQTIRTTEDGRGTATSSAWRQLATETNSGVSDLVSSSITQLVLAALFGGAVTGAAVYRFYPTIQRVKRSRQIRAAQRRSRLRAEDEKLLAEAAAEQSARGEKA